MILTIVLDPWPFLFPPPQHPANTDSMTEIEQGGDHDDMR